MVKLFVKTITDCTISEQRCKTTFTGRWLEECRNLVIFIYVKQLPMFALKSELKLDKDENKKLDNQLVTDKLLLIYKKLKNIAKAEIQSKKKLKLANLKNEQLSQIKSIESDMDLFLLAYESDKKHLSQKIQLLTQINMLLNDYSGLLRKDYSNDDFSKFFE